MLPLSALAPLATPPTENHENKSGVHALGLLVYIPLHMHVNGSYCILILVACPAKKELTPISQEGKQLTSPKTAQGSGSACAPRGKEVTV